MTRPSLRSSFLLMGLVLTACGEGAVAGSGDDVADNRPQEIQALPQRPHKSVCAASGVPGEMHCMASIVTDESGNAVPNATPQGLTPANLQSAYKIPTGAGSGLTIALVDAQDDPTAEADLATYRSQFGLPPCTTANGCFKKVNQNGVQGSYPSADQGWAGEIALDLDMVSAACPNCKILLVEATSATDANLGKAVNTAVSLGAVAVSNSYGGSESSSDTSSNSNYNHPGVIITASAGDDGYGVEFPAASPYVTAVGGTSLAASSSNSRGWVESVWGSSNNANGGTGSGCSSVQSKPSWQSDSACGKRMVADVAAVADPNSGVAVYDGYGSGGWQVYGGTSAASPLIAAILALTGHASDSLGYSYAHTGNFFDVTSGLNGSCTTAYFCKGVAGYDGPTGNGTPNATAMLSGSSSTSATSTSTGSSGTTAASTGTSGTSTTGSTGTSGTTSTGSTSSTGSSGTTGSTSGLQNGVALTGLSGAKSAKAYYTVTVPAGATNLNIAISGGTGDADLYVRFGANPTTATYDCRPYVTGNTESCSFAAPSAGTYDIMINGYAAYSGLKLEATWTAGSGSTSGGSTSGGSTGGTSGGSVLQNGVPETGLSGATGSKQNFTFVVPSSASTVKVQIAGGTGDADLYVRFGAAPTTATYDCRPYINGNGETCTLQAQAGTYHIMINGYAAYTGLSLEASYQ